MRAHQPDFVGGLSTDCFFGAGRRGGRHIFSGVGEALSSDATAVGFLPRRDGMLFQALRDQAVDELDDNELLARLEQVTAMESMLAAERLTTLAAFAGRVAGVSADLGHDEPRPGDREATGAERRWHRGVLRSVADESGLVLGLSRGTAARRIGVAIELVDLFPATMAELDAGLINEQTATTIAAELRPVTEPEARAKVEREVLNWVADHGQIGVALVVRREAAKVTAEYDEKNYRRRLGDRTTVLRRKDTGIAELAITGPAIDLQAVLNSLGAAAAAARRDGDERSMAELRTDIAIERLLGRAAAGSSAVVVHCTAAEAQALSDGARGGGGELEGYGPLPQSALRKAMADAKVRYHLTDVEPVGEPGRRAPSAALIQHIVDRDQTCQAAGCHHPAIRCDIDHRVPFPGGRTTAAGCEALCRHHHRLKHRGSWRLHRTAEGIHLWVSPTGRLYAKAPPRYG